MTYRLIIEGRLPGLNEYQNACRAHWKRGVDMKKEQVDIVALYILQQLRNIHIEKRVFLAFRWYEPNIKRDMDNISSFGRKCIQDALVQQRVLLNDGWKNISGFSDLFFVDKLKPRIEIDIIEEE